MTLRFSEFLIQEAKWAAKNNPLLSKIYAESMHFLEKEKPDMNTPLPPPTNGLSVIGEASWYDWYKSQRQINEERRKNLEELLKLVNESISAKITTKPDEGLDRLTGLAMDKVVTDGLLSEQGEGTPVNDYLTEPDAWYMDPTPCWTDLVTIDDAEEDKEIDLRHERSRAYLYPMENGAVVAVTIDSPTYLLFDKDGNHIVEDGKYVTELAPGWLAIRKEY